MTALLVGYLGWLIVRSPSESSEFVDGWCTAGFEIVGSLLCIGRGLTRRFGRAMPLTLGLSLLMWALGDLVLTILSRGDAQVPTPSWADVFYLAFYPLAYAAVVIFTRGEIRRMATPSWLDGAVAACGAAAVCAAFAFGTLVHLTGGDSAAAAVSLAYPIADVLLLGLVGGGLSVMSGQGRTAWLLMAAGLTINGVGDTANLVNASFGESHLGVIFDSIAWPASTLVLSIAVWLRPPPGNPLALPKPPSFLVPTFSATGALAVLFFGNLRVVSPVALSLATLTLLLVGIRLVGTVRGMKALSLHRHQQSVTDELTGLGNRRRLHTVLDAFFAEHALDPTRQIALLFIDLDRFKEVNDTFGHPAGDELLRQLGPRLSACLRDSDLLIRLGGDEFVALLLDADAGFAADIAARLTAALNSSFVLGTVSANVNCSIGIALVPGDASDVSGLLRCADIAMYRAKQAGDTFAVYRLDLDNAGNRLTLADELSTAIADHQLVLHYQPQLDLTTNRITSVESLVRWVHPTRGLIPPLEFLPFAEDAGLMSEITGLVLADAIGQCAEWRRQGRQLAVSVNVSPTNLLDAGFIDQVRALLHAHQLPPEALTIEITETSVIAEFERAQQVIAELWGLGIVVSIDDFGAGFTSLAHLGSLAVKELKLDRAFVSGITAGGAGQDLSLVRATIDLGHALGLRIVAEGIEDAPTLQLLAELGCDRGQGYYIGRPKPAELLDLRDELRSIRIDRARNVLAGQVGGRAEAL